MTPRHYRLLQSLANGDCPRCSKREFQELQQLPGMVTALQLESAHGADTRSGYSLAPLHTGEATAAAIAALLGGTRVAAASQKTKRPVTKSRLAGELTRKEFEVIAKVMQSEPPAKDAAFMVLVKGEAIDAADAATLALRWHGVVPAHRGRGYSEAAFEVVRQEAIQANPAVKLLVELVPLADALKADRLLWHFRALGFSPAGEPMDATEFPASAALPPTSGRWQAMQHTFLPAPKARFVGKFLFD